MKVTFTKTETAGYTTSIAYVRPVILSHEPVHGDVHLPYDLALFVIEKEFGVRHGIFGQLADQRTPGQRDRIEHSRPSQRRPSANDDADRSQRLFALCMPLWQARAGHPPTAPALIDMTLATPFDVDRVLHDLDDMAARWADLRTGESIELDWDSELAVSGGARAR